MAASLASGSAGATNELIASQQYGCERSIRRHAARLWDRVETSNTSSHDRATQCCVAA